MGRLPRLTRIFAAWLGIAAGLGVGSASVLAQQLSDQIWLPPGANISAILSTEPGENLAVDPTNTELSILQQLGRLAFRSSLILGGRAARLGLSCNSCHRGGGANTHFFLPGLSDIPGNIDVRHQFFNRLFDDGVDQFVNIPSLRGVRWTAPYGRDGRNGSLKDFTRDVIVLEFDGREPPEILLDALVAYQQALQFPPNWRLGPFGRLAGGAPLPIRRGQKIFAADCAGCHRPESGFIDRLAHDIGTEGRFETATLLGIAATAPYFHDGRAPDLASVISHYEGALGRSYEPGQRQDLLAYLFAVGADDRAEQPVNLDRDINRLIDFGKLAVWPLDQENSELADYVIDMLRLELGKVFDRYPAPDNDAARRALIARSKDLGRINQLVSDGNFADARRDLLIWIDLMESNRPILAAAVNTSLYDLENLSDLQK